MYASAERVMSTSVSISISKDSIPNDLTHGALIKTYDGGTGKIEIWRQKFFPAGFKQELKGLSALAWPAGLATLFAQSFGMVSLMFCGQLGRVELDGVGMAMSLLNITGLSIILGLVTACDTLFSQAYGGKNKYLVGIYLQRSLLVVSMSVFFCWAIHLNAEGVLLILGQPPEVARVAGIYLLYFMPGLLFNCIIQVFIKYLQNQNRVIAAVVLGFIGNLVNILAQYLAIYVLEAGIIGSAIGQVISYFIMLTMMVCYIVFTGLYKETWAGWSFEAFEQWGQFISLAVAGLIMIAIEWWSFEIGLFLNGLIGEVELGATSVVFQLEQLFYMIPCGIGIASSIRVGHSLGRGDAKAAKTTAMSAQVFAWICFVVTAVILVGLKNVLPLLFTKDEEIIELAAGILPILGVVAFLDSIVANSMGTLRGCGRQWTGAICNAAGYIGVSIPVCVVLMFVVGMGAFGFWWAVCIGITPTAALYMIIILFRIDWDDEVQKAERRTWRPKKIKVRNEKAPLLSAEADIAQDPSAVTPNLPNVIYSSNMIDYERTISVDPDFFRRKRIQLVLTRLLGFCGVLAVFVLGLCIRIFVPLPAADWLDVNPAINATLPTTAYEL